ncbi:HAD-IIB family hydrolase [Lignipirellula cremea]|uniref:Mannosylfructose-phosphate phosphatase n=1 Tax=Lignipirellula cremea TaxID=2528010 RepID=A0A518DZT4_9BACT|nr:HAD-IIB family hydrolase [Lignipirellula cremea]QDU97352.1 Mannosylfructose-phosphate phosphatase [Lignipirellula cremea]
MPLESTAGDGAAEPADAADPRLLIVSDVDGTMLGDDEGLARFVAWWEPLRDVVLLAYNSGRFVESLQESVRDTGLPEPHAFIGGVGTQIELTASAGEPQRLLDWPVRSTKWQAQRVQAAAASFQQLELQPSHLQSEFKISYFGYDLSPTVLQQIEQSLQAAGLQAAVVYSSQRDLDILPAGVHKGTAAGRLAREFRISPERVIVCGDTGNDLAMFQEGYHGVVVGNAHAELKQLDSRRVYQAGSHCAAGVLEGVRHWREQWSGRPAKG